MTLKLDNPFSCNKNFRNRANSRFVQCFSRVSKNLTLYPFLPERYCILTILARSLGLNPLTGKAHHIQMLTRQFLTKEDRYLITYISFFFISAKTFLRERFSSFLIGQNWITGCSNPSCKGNGISITGDRPLNIYSFLAIRGYLPWTYKEVAIQT